MGAVLTLAVKILQKGVDVKDLQVNSLESRDYTRVSIISLVYVRTYVHHGFKYNPSTVLLPM